MCGRVRKSKMKPGASFSFITSLGVTKGTWGFNNGEGYNARSERLDTIWKKYKKGILTVDAFWEGGVEFIRSKNNVFSLGIVYNPKNEFAIVTCPANTLVEPYHHRMPVMLADQSIDKWLEQGVIEHMDDSEIIKIIP